MSANNEQTEEHIERQDKVLNQLENKRKMVLDFLSKGEKLMEDPNCPKFLEGHAKKLKEAWEETTEKAHARKKALAGQHKEHFPNKHCDPLGHRRASVAYL